MAERALPDIKSRLTIDDRDLQRVTANAEAATAKIEASFAAASASTEELSLGLANVDRSLANTSRETAAASASLGNYDRSLTATAASADVATTAAAEQVVAQERVAAAYGVSTESADVYNASLGATGPASARATTSLEAQNVALAGVARNAEAATAAEAGLNTELGVQTGLSEANAASTGALRAATVDYGTVLNNAATTLSGVADAEKAAIDSGVDLGATFDSTVGSLRAVADVSGEQSAASKLAAFQLAGLTAQSRAVATETRTATAVSKSFVDRLGEQAKQTGVLGTATVDATTKLRGLGNILGPAGAIPVGTTAAIVAIAGLYVGIKQLSSSVQTYLALADAVRRYSLVSGESVEVASRQVQAFQVLGVDADTASNAMVKLSKAIDTNPQKLTALGITVARTNAGTVDLNATLDNIIGAWNTAGSAVDRNTIAITAFGKSGANLIPILAAGTKQLRELEAAASVVFTQDDLDRARKLEIQSKRLGEQFTEVKTNIGGFLVPALSAMADKNLENTYITRQLQKEGETWIGAQLRLTRVVDSHVDALRRQYRAQSDARFKADQLTQSLKDQQDAAEKAAQASDDLSKALEDSADAGLAVQHAQLSLIDASGQLKQAQKDVADAVKQYGAKSQEARDATTNLQQAQLSNIEAIRKLAQAQVDLTVKQGEANGETFTGTQQHRLFIQQLQILANTLAPNSPLRVQLQQYINQLNAVPASITTDIWAHFKQITQNLQGFVGGGAGATQPTTAPDTRRRQFGGEVLPGRIYSVGESEEERLFMYPGGGGRVVPSKPREESKPMTKNYYVTVQGNVMSNRDMLLYIREGIRRLEMEQR